MAENYNSDSEKKSIVQRFLDLFKKTSNEVKEKVQDTVEDVKSSDFGGKVADVAENVRDKAKDVVEDIKDSKFAEKVGDAAGKAKEMSGKALEKLGSLANLPVLINAGKKLQESPEDTTEKENLLNALDTKVAAILEDGVISPEEEALLVEEARAIGIDVDEFLAEVRGRLENKE